MSRQQVSRGPASCGLLGSAVLEPLCSQSPQGHPWAAHGEAKVMGSQGTSDVRPIVPDTHHPFMSQHVWELHQPESRGATAPRAELQNPGFALCSPASGG